MINYFFDDKIDNMRNAFLITIHSIFVEPLHHQNDTIDFDYFLHMPYILNTNQIKNKKMSLFLRGSAINKKINILPGYNYYLLYEIFHDEDHV